VLLHARDQALVSESVLDEPGQDKRIVLRVLARILWRYVKGGGEDVVLAAALTAIGRSFPTTSWRDKSEPYRVAKTTHHERKLRARLDAYI
jgi:hypothetical protein